MVIISEEIADDIIDTARRFDYLFENIREAEVVSHPFTSSRCTDDRAESEVVLRPDVDFEEKIVKVDIYEKTKKRFPG